MNFWDVLILLAVVAAVIPAVIRIRRHRKAGSCSCGCGCSTCNGCSLSKETKER